MGTYAIGLFPSASRKNGGLKRCPECDALVGVDLRHRWLLNTRSTNRGPSACVLCPARSTLSTWSG